MLHIQELALATISIISSLLIVCVVVLIGWYLVWKLSLSRFKLVRELLGQANENLPFNCKTEQVHIKKSD